MTVALFIGRFQPFHKAHLADIKAILETNEKVIIGVGSSQYSNNPDNPFSFEERKQMIEDALSAANIYDYEIFAIPDIHSDNEWADHVAKSVPHFDICYSGNEQTQKLFEEKGIKVEKLHILPNLSATEVRKRISEGGDYKELLTVPVIKYLETIDGEKRIKALTLKTN